MTTKLKKTSLKQIILHIKLLSSVGLQVKGVVSTVMPVELDRLTIPFWWGMFMYDDRTDG